MMSPAANDPRRIVAGHHFSGTLREIHHACVNDLWQIVLRLDSADGRSVQAYIACGRGEGGAMACSLQIAMLTIGQRYYGRATLHNRGDVHDHYAGQLHLSPELRRPPLRLVTQTATGDNA